MYLAQKNAICYSPCLANVKHSITQHWGHCKKGQYSLILISNVIVSKSASLSFTIVFYKMIMLIHLTERNASKIKQQQHINKNNNDHFVRIGK